MKILVTGQDGCVRRNLTVRLLEMPDIETVAEQAAQAPDTILRLDADGATVNDAATGDTRHVFRWPEVFGKWCEPDARSIVARLCHDIARGVPVEIDDPAQVRDLVHVDDVVDALIAGLAGTSPAPSIGPVYRVTAGALAEKIQSYRDVRSTFITERVGAGLDRALYSTYVSYLPPDAFTYKLPMHADPRGVFVEFLKTHDSGQMSFFIAKPGVTRGGHYHHTKTEKFLVIQGRASFRFRHIVTNQTHVVTVSGDLSEVVETVPGWAHDITNTGDDDLVVILWANEIFDRNRPDTVVSRTE